MNAKHYVSLEVAKLLKEKGYNEECNATIDDDGELFDEKYLTNQDLPKWRWSCPTKAEAIDWLESKGIVVELIYDDQAHMDNARWEYFIYIQDEDGWVEIMVRSWEEVKYFQTRLEAEDAAIIKALELL